MAATELFAVTAITAGLDIKTIRAEVFATSAL